MLFSKSAGEFWFGLGVDLAVISLLSLFLAISPSFTYLSSFAIFGILSSYVNFRSLDMAGRLNISLFHLIPFSKVDIYSKQSRFYFVMTESVVLLLLLVGISLFVPTVVFLYVSWILFISTFLTIRIWHFNHLVSFARNIEYDQ